MTYKERISGTVSAITEHTACCWCKTWIVNGVERLQAYQGFFMTANQVIAAFRPAVTGSK